MTACSACVDKLAAVVVSEDPRCVRRRRQRDQQLTVEQVRVDNVWLELGKALPDPWDRGDGLDRSMSALHSERGTGAPGTQPLTGVGGKGLQDEQFVAPCGPRCNE